MLYRVPRRTVLGVSGVGITTFVLPGAASAASFEGTTLGSTGPDLLALSTADAGDGTHDVVLTVTLTDSGGDPYLDAARVDMTVGDDQGDPTGTTVDGEATGTASKLATTGTVTFAVAFPAYGDHQFTVATTPAAASHPAGITLLYTHSGLPGAPTSPSGTAGDGQVALTWTAPADTGGLTLDRYETRYSSDGGSSWSSWATTGSTSAAVTVTGLDNGTGYVFQVRAVNTNGAGDASTSTTTLTPTGTPGAPTSVAGTPGDEQVALTWSAPADDGGLTISRYETRYSSDSGSNWSAWTTTGSSSVSATVTGLTNGTAYVFQVRAANDNGRGGASTTSTAVTPRTTPAAPTITGITAGNEELSVAFTAGSDNGESIDNYEYELDASGTWTALSPADTTSPLTITGLTDGTTYAVRIRAVNAAGSGAASNSVNGTPIAGLPSQLAALGTALSGYTASTSVSTVVSAIEGQGFTVIAVPESGAMAESLVGSTATSLSSAGTFRTTSFESSSALTTSAGFSTSALNGHPFLGLVMFNGSSFFGTAVMLFRSATTGTRLRDLFNPRQYRDLYTYVRDADGSVRESTSTVTRWQFSNDNSPGTYGYYLTSRFSSDDGMWGFTNGGSRSAGSAGTGLTAAAGNYGAANMNSSDSSAGTGYWNGSSFTGWRMYVITQE